MRKLLSHFRGDALNIIIVRISNDVLGNLDSEIFEPTEVDGRAGTKKRELEQEENNQASEYLLGLTQEETTPKIRCFTQRQNKAEIEK